MSWDPTQYLAFAGPRLRPAVDLLARVESDAPGTVVDLGCGPGNVTALLRARWPEASLTGVDNSAEMLAAAPENCPGATWLERDIADWTPDAPPDLIYSNAALHWIDGHDALLPRLIGWLAPGGALAVQMPNNWRAPSHKLMEQTVEVGPWAPRLAPMIRAEPVLAPAVYYDILGPHVTALDIWETEYLHVLEGDDPVVAFTKGAALKPFLDALAPDEAAAFETDYTARIARAYPPRADGRTLFPFRRLFIVARV